MAEKRNFTPAQQRILHALAGLKPGECMHYKNLPAGGGRALHKLVTEFLVIRGDRGWRLTNRGVWAYRAFAETTCALCQLPRGDHQAKTLCCPTGERHRTLGFSRFAAETFRPYSVTPKEEDRG